LILNPLSANVEYTPAVVALRTGKIIKAGQGVFERGENFLHYGILHFVCKLSQSSEIALES